MQILMTLMKSLISLHMPSLKPSKLETEKEAIIINKMSPTLVNPSPTI